MVGQIGFATSCSLLARLGKEILPPCLLWGPEIAFLEHEEMKRGCACLPSVARIFSGFPKTTACSIANGLSFVTYSWLCPFIECERFEIGFRRMPFRVMAPQTLPWNDPFQGTVCHRGPSPKDRGQAYMRHSAVRFRSFAMPRNNPLPAERSDML